MVRSPVGPDARTGFGLRRILRRQAGRDRAVQRRAALGGDGRAAQGHDRAGARHRRRRRPRGRRARSLRGRLPGPRRLLRRAERQPALGARDVHADRRGRRCALRLRQRRQGRGARAGPHQRPQRLAAGPARATASCRCRCRSAPRWWSATCRATCISLAREVRRVRRRAPAPTAARCAPRRSRCPGGFLVQTQDGGLYALSARCSPWTES